MYIDTHCHLSHCFASPFLLASTEYEKISYLIDISISPSEILNLHNKLPSSQIKHAFGYYPELCTSWNSSEKSRLTQWVNDLNPIAIGEIGLDYYHQYGTPRQQQHLFVDQLEIAALAQKPALIHSREAFHDTHSILRQNNPRTPIILHCFGYGAQELEQFLQIENISVSFAGNITYPAAHTLREALRLVPRERLFLETDAPYLTPVPMRGKKNTPQYIEYTYLFAAQHLECELPDLCQQISQNFSRVFLRE